MKQDWQSISACWSNWKTHSVDPVLRLLLSSDGTTVRSLNALLLRPVSLEVMGQQSCLVSGQLASQLGVPEGEKAIERSVWLNIEKESGTEKLIYAVSTLPVSKLNPDVYQALQLREKPLGRIIETQSIPTFRDQLEVAYLPFEAVAATLALKEDTLFWARRYRLLISGQVSALICEVFSPRLSSQSF